MVNYLTAVPKLLRLAYVIVSANRSGRRLEDYQARALWQQKQAIRFLRAFRIKVTCQGGFPTKGLLICNHLSYIDILAIASQGPVVFVSKSDVLKWPLIGNLLKYTGTILAYRKQPIKAAQTASEVLAALGREIPVAFFPEGTSSNGETVLPFRSPFFQSAHEASARITPAAIHYTSKTGDPGADICYWGDHTFSSHVVKLATIKEIIAHIKFDEAQPCRSDRKASAAHFHEEVSRLYSELKQQPD